MRTGFRYALAEHVGGAVLDVLMHTLRIRVENAEAYREPVQRGQPVIFVLWHGRLLPLGFVHRDQRIVGLASRSADGEYIARLLQHWGLSIVRGSSSGGGDTAFRELVRNVRAGRSVAITPDGPRGPREKLKPGVLQLAQLTGAPLVPVAAACSRAWWFVSWDRFLVPKPFAALHVAYGEPIYVARQITDHEAFALKVERALNGIMARVEQRAA